MKLLVGPQGPNQDFQKYVGDQEQLGLRGLLELAMNSHMDLAIFSNHITISLVIKADKSNKVDTIFEDPNFGSNAMI